ncbi:hypothetical protein BY996DRAFT_6418580 [Phakopsora pachyrhizi]|uniref:Expressed protein n=1 Tax=Phakopsora pachyrhizi TaxID=170000 RepID=A0AAV0BD35_PHAPC|nr:hypothetical protein BY996DRAFT_6418580 [Phakopsora pachyrhizi]CAH7684183.1 expressed protein [Phakopsora pachyrhizi]
MKQKAINIMTRYQKLDKKQILTKVIKKNLDDLNVYLDEILKYHKGSAVNEPERHKQLLTATNKIKALIGGLESYQAPKRHGNFPDSNTKVILWTNSNTDFNEDTMFDDALCELLKTNPLDGQKIASLAATYVLDHQLAKIEKALMALRQNVYTPAWFETRVHKRSTNVYEFDPFLNGLDFKDYVVNHPDMANHRAILNALDPTIWREELINLLKLYSDIYDKMFLGQTVLFTSHSSSATFDQAKHILSDLQNKGTIEAERFLETFNGNHPSYHISAQLYEHVYLYHAYKCLFTKNDEKFDKVNERIEYFEKVFKVYQALVNYVKQSTISNIILLPGFPVCTIFTGIDHIRLYKEKDHYAALDFRIFNDFKTFKEEASKVEDSLLLQYLTNIRNNIHHANSEVENQLINFKNLKDSIPTKSKDLKKFSESTLMTQIENDINLLNQRKFPFNALQHMSEEWLTEVTNKIAAKKIRPNKLLAGFFSNH